MTSHSFVLPDYVLLDPPTKNFGTWNAVSFPYCDGSVFMGDNDVPVADGNVRHFHGRQNLAAGLDVAVAHFPDPKRILLVGWSAGGYGTITTSGQERQRPGRKFTYSS